MVGLEAVQTAPLLRRRLAKGHWARRLGDHHVGRRWSGLPGDPLAHSLTAQSGAALASEVRAVHRRRQCPSARVLLLIEEGLALHRHVLWKVSRA